MRYPLSTCKPKTLALAVALASTSLLLLPSLVHAQQAETTVAQTINTDIAAGSLSSALNQLAQVTGVALSYKPSLTAGKTTQGVKAGVTLEQALQQLLVGSGIQFSRSEKTVTLVEINAEVMMMAPVRVSDTVVAGIAEDANSYTARGVTIGKGNQSLREIPQSVSVVSRARLDDGNISSLPEALKYVTGVTVTKYDGAGYFNEFSARGYSADSFQLDGINMQTNGNMAFMDLSVMERVEVQRGAAGLFQGSGEPGVVVNMVRKRALAETKLQGLLSAGSWDTYRAEADITGALNDDVSMRGRIVVVADDRDSFLNGVESKKNVIYGTLEYDLQPSTTLSVGLTWQDIDSKIDQGLPSSPDGSLIDFPRETAVVPAWNNQDMESKDAFVELEHTLTDGGLVKFIVRHNERDKLYNGSRSNSYPEADGTITVSNEYGPTELTDTSADVFFQRSLQVFGRDHQFTLGADYRHSDQLSGWSVLGYDPYLQQANILNFNPNIPEPNLVSEGGDYVRTETEQKGVYSRLKISTSDRLSFLLGARLSWWDSQQVDLGTSEVSSEYDAEAELTPYAAAMFDLNRNLSLYASYSNIFQPQNAITRSGKQIDPRTGEQIETGIKAGWFDNRLNAHAAIYRIRDKNRALADPTDDQFSIAAGEVLSEGFELEASGEVLPNWHITAGYANTSTEYVTSSVDEQGKTFDSYTPKHNLNLWTKYTFREGVMSGIDVGGGVHKVSSFYEEYDAKTESPGYAVFSLQAAYPINPNLKVSVNVDNVFDKKYYEKVANWYRQNFYGEPRSVSVTLRGTF